ncbi:unnamed protein product [Bemisia tabaci]|uniref:Uncharacterized protein n=1 Tax=Bemisia tabaci TaxID=7038 RepID=A0AAI8UPJ9_BEMTA|nr:unnamed protein product [Bemisia tabaci]
MTFFSTCETAVKLKGSVRVIDGGFMVHKIVWHRQEIFSQILDKHVEYVQKNYSPNTSGVFDGYPEDSAAKSTKTAERCRRAKSLLSPEIIFEENLLATVTLSKFRANEKNKSRLIALLRESAFLLCNFLLTSEKVKCHEASHGKKAPSSASSSSLKDNAAEVSADPSQSNLTSSPVDQTTTISSSPCPDVNKTHNPPPLHKPPGNLSFAQAVSTSSSSSSNTNNLTKEHAIIIPVIDQLTLLDYLRAVGEFVPPKEIIYASRISNGRMCMYLSEIKWVDTVVAQNNIITKQGPLRVRRMINPTMRLTLSNANPLIRHSKIIDALTEFVIPCSQLQHVTAGVRDHDFSHVLSFRRQIFVQFEEGRPKLPDSILLQHGEEEVRIFINIDDPRHPSNTLQPSKNPILM